MLVIKRIFSKLMVHEVNDNKVILHPLKNGQHSIIDVRTLNQILANSSTTTIKMSEFIDFIYTDLSLMGVNEENYDDMLFAMCKAILFKYESL